MLGVAVIALWRSAGVDTWRLTLGVPLKTRAVEGGVARCRVVTAGAVTRGTGRCMVKRGVDGARNRAAGAEICGGAEKRCIAGAEMCGAGGAEMCGAGGAEMRGTAAAGAGPEP